MSSTVPLTPDATTIARFAEVVFRGIDGFASVRILGEKGGPKVKPRSRSLAVGPDLPSEVLALAKSAAPDKAGLFIAPATMAEPGRGTADRMKQAAVVLVDLDDGDIDNKCAHLVRHLGAPTLEVASGGSTCEGQRKRHLYWSLSEPAAGDDFARVVEIRKMLAAKVGGDPAFGGAAQLIRVPGSIYGKNGAQRLVEIVARDSHSYHLGSFEAAVLEMPAIAGLSPPPTQKRPRARQLMTRATREGGVDGVTRHDAMTKVIGHWLRQERLGNTKPEETWAAVAEYNVACLQPSLPEDELRREFAALRELDGRRHGQTVGWNLSLTEDGLARAFVDSHHHMFRHVDGEWLSWSGQHWEHGGRAAVMEAIRGFCGSIARVRHLSDDKRLQRLGLFKAIEELSRSDRQVAAPAHVFDQEPMLLNTPGGIIDLATGEVRSSDPAAHMMRITSVAAGRGCPRWETFIGEVAGGDRSLAAYLARLAGYILTGSNDEQAYFFLHGAGGNGKSTFVNVLAAVLGSYATAAPFDTFLASKGERHPTDLAGLRGARLITAIEPDRGRRWSESRIKALTGGDKIAARRMRADFSEFTACGKIVFAGNHVPGTSIDEAMRRRLQIIPFSVNFSGEQRVRGLENQILEEGEGILGWMIDGCLEWQRRGLETPSAVKKASKAYFEEEDNIGHWITEECEVRPGCRTRSRELYTSYRAYAEQSGLTVVSLSALVVDLKRRGFSEYRTANERGLEGLTLRVVVAEPAAGPA